MKKRIFVAGLLALLCVMPAWAHAEQLGVYVTPKFVYGSAIMNSTKFKETVIGAETKSFKISNGSDSAVGGSIAVGYDFGKRFDVPVRAEIEYAFFSTIENKGARSSLLEDWGSTSSYKQDFRIQTLFFNAYYDFETGTAFKPYVGAGLGMAFVNTKGKFKDEDFSSGITTYTDSYSTGSKNRTNFAWNLGAGVAYEFTENIALDLSYRFVGLGSVKTKARTLTDEYGDTFTRRGRTENLYMHQLALGLRVSF